MSATRKWKRAARQIAKLIDFVPNISADLAEVVHKAMAPLAKDRYPTARAFREALEPFVTAPPPPSRAQPSSAAPNYLGSEPVMPPVDGVHFATGAAGIRYAGRTDVLLALFEAGTAVAGVFTTSKCPSAPVDWCRAKLAGGRARALVVNSGNANAFTGRRGAKAVTETAEHAATAAHGAHIRQVP